MAETIGPETLKFAANIVRGWRVNRLTRAILDGHARYLDTLVSAWGVDRKRLEEAQTRIKELTMRLGDAAQAFVQADLREQVAELDRKRLEEWQRAATYLHGHYPEDVFPPNGITPDAKAGTFARRLLTWLLDPVERARLAALAAGEKP